MADEARDVRDMVKDAYGKIARGGSTECCSSAEQTAGSCCSAADVQAGSCCAAISPDALEGTDLGLSCGNPVSFSQVREGETVLDLGSGAGRDVFIAAKLAGENGRVIGVDMTPDMLALAWKNAVKFAEKHGLDNVEFRPGHIEKLPVEDESIDLVISNCVINLSPDKPAVFREIHRVLKPGGRMVVSDIVLDGDLPDEMKSDESLYVSCVSGALPREEYLKAIHEAGFGAVDILADSSYSIAKGCCDDAHIERVATRVEDVAASITVLASKSGGKRCCGS